MKYIKIKDIFINLSNVTNILRYENKPLVDVREKRYIINFSFIGDSCNHTEIKFVNLDERDKEYDRLEQMLIGDNDE